MEIFAKTSPCSNISNTSIEEYPMVLMGGQAEGQACADPGARTPIGAIGILQYTYRTFSQFAVVHIKDSYPKIIVTAQLNLNWSWSLN
jgi:urocanate hydratase